MNVARLSLFSLTLVAALSVNVSQAATQFSAAQVHNSDMEQIARDAKTHAAIPVGWKAGGDLAYTFSAVGPDVMNAASGSYYARLATQNAAGHGFWIVSDFIPSTGKKAAVINLSVRSTFTDVRVSIHEFDASWKEIAIVDGPAINFTDSSWVRYADKSGAYTLAINPKATNIEITIEGLAQAGANVLDVDAVSIQMK